VCGLSSYLLFLYSSVPLKCGNAWFLDYENSNDPIRGIP